MSSSDDEGRAGETGRNRRADARLACRGGSIELLRLPAALYGVITGVRAGLYDRGWLPTTRLDGPVVSVGNLTAGGTGKTPFVAFLVRELTARGWRPGVLSRGYRATTEEGVRGNDEARMLARVLGDVPHVQDRDRVAGGRRLLAGDVDVVVLDDGFQHRRLRRDLDFVLVDATRPWGLPSPDRGDAVRALLPRGLLREQPEQLQRAHALVLTRADLVAADRLAALEAELMALAPGLPILVAEHRPTELQGPDGAAHPSALRGRTVDLVSGLGNPQAFEATVRALGAEIGLHRAFPDHHGYRPGDLAGLGEGGRWLVTTAKDGVKLRGAPREPHVLHVELTLRSGRAVLDALLSAVPTGSARLQRQNLHEGLHG